MFSHSFFAESIPTWALLVEILLAGSIVVFSGARVAFLADGIATRYQLGGAWVGMLLLATVTSLPEVVAGCTSVAVGRPSMAFGAIFGSCAFNVFLVVLLNIFVGGGSILSGKPRVHALSSSCGIVLMVLAVVTVLAASRFSDRLSTARSIEIASAVIITLTYAASMLLVFRAEKDAGPPVEQPVQGKPQARHLGIRITAFSMILVGAAWWMARTGDVLADHPLPIINRPLGATFIGMLFLAIATSLPEIVTGLASVRMGNIDMALGNIFGSNMFNILVIPMMTVTSVLTPGAGLTGGADFDANRIAMAGLLPILLAGVVVGSINSRSRRRLLNRLGIDSVLIALIYVGGMCLLMLDY